MATYAGGSGSDTLTGSDLGDVLLGRSVLETALLWFNIQIPRDPVLRTDALMRPLDVEGTSDGKLGLYMMRWYEF